MTAQMVVRFPIGDDTRMSDLENRLELTAATQGVVLGEVDWSDPHTLKTDVHDGLWITATAPIHRIGAPQKKGARHAGS